MEREANGILHREDVSDTETIVVTQSSARRHARRWLRIVRFKRAEQEGQSLAPGRISEPDFTTRAFRHDFICSSATRFARWVSEATQSDTIVRP